MEHVSTPSDFLPSQRMSPGEVEALAARLSAWSPLEGFFQAHPQPMALITETRQIVWANAALARLAGVSDPALLRSKRPGEAFGCVSAHIKCGGCGTSRRCRDCGLCKALFDAMRWGQSLVVDGSFTSLCAGGERLLLLQLRGKESEIPLVASGEDPPVEVRELYAALCNRRFFSSDPLFSRR
ncbi:MAG: hypothetical protein HY820_22120 [Acidobacteria bacterium]|nr:hypothetical protein [Acidobacteriota bacterium]